MPDSDSNSLITLLFIIVLVIITVTTAIPTSQSPVIITSPDTESMVPTIETTDLVIAISSNEYASEDVILFRDSNVDQLILHRIVDETEEGYITQGDANDITDQEAGLDPVSNSQISGRLVTYEDDPITIPYIGLIYSQTELLVLGWIIFLIFTIFGSAITEPEYKHNEFSFIRTASVLILIFCLVAISISFFFPTIETLTYVVSQQPPPDSPDVVGLNNTKEQSMVIDNGLNLITTQYPEFSSNQIQLQSVSRTAWDETEFIFINEPQSSIGPIETEVTVYTYLRVLPRPLLYSIAQIHPLLGSVASVGIIGSIILLILRLFIDPMSPYRTGKDQIRTFRNKR